MSSMVISMCTQYPNKKMDDKAGLDEAYNTDEGTYTKGTTLFIAGTKSFGDVLDDIAIPLGMTNTTARHRDASMVLNANPRIRRVVGHSLGGAVALQLQKENPELQAVTYGAPVFSLSGSADRYRELGDPVAALDFGSSWSLPAGWNPHAYSRLANNKNLRPQSISTEIR